jgi:hypothetical protein
VTIDLKEVERRARAAGWRVSGRLEDGNGIMFENIGMLLGGDGRYPDAMLSVWADGKTYATIRSAGDGGQSLMSYATLVEMMRAHLLGHDLGASLTVQDAAVLGDHLRELGAAEWRVAAALDVLTRKAP